MCSVAILLWLTFQPMGAHAFTPPFEVPADHYFLLGDNRDNAGDSRVTSRLGFVPREAILGRVDKVLCRQAPD